LAFVIMTGAFYLLDTLASNGEDDFSRGNEQVSAAEEHLSRLI
jgi:hypothetical protein